MLKQRLQDDMKAALKAGDKRRLGVVRLINAAIKQREVDERIELDDTQVLAVLDKMLKQRRDSITPVRAGWPRRPCRPRAVRGRCLPGLYAGCAER